MAELKPCPFCGGNAVLTHDLTGPGASYIQCKKCGVESVKFIRSFSGSSDDQAIEFWNRRANDESICCYRQR